MVGSRQRTTKRQIVIAERNDKAIKKLVKTQSLLSSTSTISHAQRKSAIFRLEPIPPADDINIQCPECEHQMTKEHVVDGFQNDNYKFTTACPICEHRFATTSVFRIMDQTERVVWLCRAQTIQAFEDWFDTTKTEPDTVLEQLIKRPEIIWNIMRYSIHDGINVLTWIIRKFPHVQINEDEEFYRLPPPPQRGGGGEEEESSN